MTACRSCRYFYERCDTHTFDACEHPRNKTNGDYDYKRGCFDIVEKDEPYKINDGDCKWFSPKGMAGRAMHRLMYGG
jgi:hypothetical protein